MPRLLGLTSIQRISQKCIGIIFEEVLTAQLANNNAEGFDSQHLPSSLHSGDKKMLSIQYRIAFPIDDMYEIPNSVPDNVDPM